jgi:hypothetical protein
MCLAIYKPAGKSIPVDHLRNGFESNPHGAGFAFANDGVVSIRKGYFSFKEFLAAYNEIVSDELPVLVHFRYATHGKRNEFNCHPWPVCGGEYACIHNGIINIESSKKKSDTGHFVDLVLTPMLECVADPATPALKFLVEETIGTGNKIVLMDGAGKVTIYNEKAGHWEQGVWYSNHGYEGYGRYHYKRGRHSYPYYSSGYGDYDDGLWPANQSTRKKNTGGSQVVDPVGELTTQQQAFPDFDGADVIEQGSLVPMLTTEAEACDCCGSVIELGETAYMEDDDVYCGDCALMGQGLAQRKAEAGEDECLG